MMPPELSRRLGKVSHRLLDMIGVEHYYKLVYEAELVQSFQELSEWHQHLVLRAEDVRGLARVLKHLQGQHDQHTHGRDGSGGLRAPTGDTLAVEAEQIAMHRGGLPEPVNGHAIPGELVWPYELRTVIRREVAQTIANKTGLTLDAVEKTMLQWEGTSNDSDMRSLSIQEAAAEVFDTKLSEWQSEKIAYLKATPDIKQDSMLQNNYAPYPTSKDAVKAILTEMHAETQKRFKEQGVKSVVLYRGTTASIPEDDIFNLKSNSLESWTISQPVARNFGYNIIKAEVPVERILSTSHTGLGALNEYEFIVIGNKPGDQATSIPF